jgi:hypothetical protein
MSTLRRWRSAAVVFALLMVMFTTWTIGMPLFTSPDEAAHLYKAYGTAHLEMLGDVQPGQSTNIRVFDVPSGHDGVMASTAAVYPPFWYAVVGGAARVIGESTHQRAYRAISALLCAALIALAFESARRSRQASLSPLLLIGMTPMTVFLTGTLNPNGFEIAGFILAWSLCLHLGRPRVATVSAGFIVGALVAAMLLSRFASVVWVAAAGVIAAILLGWAGIRQLGRRFFIPAIGCAVAAVGALAAWSAYSGVSADDPRTAVDWTRGHVIRETIDRLPGLTKQMIGQLGWLDTPMPFVVHLLFGLLTLVVIIGVVLSRDRRLMVVTALVVVALLVVPIVVNVISAPTAGLIWQGRYSLSMFAAFGFIGMLAWRTTLDRVPSAEVEVLLRYGVCTAFVVAEVVAFWQALRRYTVGSHGKIWLTDPLPWQPDVAPMVLIVVNLLAATALCGAILRSTSSRYIGPP